MSSWRRPVSVLLAALPLVLSAPVSFAASNANTPIVLRDDTGVTARLPHAARRIVSLISSDTQIMLALGLRRRLVGVDLDSIDFMAAPYQRLVKGLPSIGNTYPAPSIERILKTRPDLVLSSGAVSAATTAKLRSLGIPVLVLNPQNISGIDHDIALVGKATGAQAAAARLVARMRASVARLRSDIHRTATHPTVYVEIGANPYYSVGPGSYIDSLLKLIGAQNVVDRTVKTSYPELSSEAVIAMNPQTIILDEPGVTAAQVAARPGWGAITAVRFHRIYKNVDMNALSEPGPAVITALWQMAHDLYPHLGAPSPGA